MAASQYDGDFLSELSQYFPPETSEKEMIDLYSNPKLFEQYLQELQAYHTELQQNYSVYHECALPVVTQMWESMSHLLLFALVLRCLSLIRLPRDVLNFLSLLLGCMSLWRFYGHLMVYIVSPVIFSSIIMRTRTFGNGLFLSLLAAIYMCSCEFLLFRSVHWNKIKGSVMIISMKLISVAFDVENGIIPKSLTPIELFGYVFNPASVIFGPFVTYNDYQQLFYSHKISFLWFLNCCKCVCLAVVCLLWSSCGITNYLPQLTSYVPQLEDSRWWTAYKDAQSFRFSHYFVSYFSESTCLLMGIGTIGSFQEQNEATVLNKQEEKRKTKENEKDESENKEKENTVVSNDVIWSRPVAHMSPVEVPRSLANVVTNWNIPMHYWLKQYIFKSTRKYGVFAAILITYIASSILHSLNFQLSAVLLSIGVFAYVESVFRHQLSNMLSACIEARACKPDCGHRFKKWTFWVVCINLFFSFVAVWNLAYVGCLFDTSGEEEKGYSMSHTLKKWKNYDYINHLVMLTVFVVQKVLSKFN